MKYIQRAAWLALAIVLGLGQARAYAPDDPSNTFQKEWFDTDGDSAVDTECYIINTKEDFLTLMDTPSYWKYDFMQTQDINLEGVEVKAIGRCSDDYKPSATGAARYECAFTGSYNGGGHTLSNAVYYWDKSGSVYRGSSSNDHCTGGLFGYIRASNASERSERSLNPGVRNLNIVNFHWTRGKGYTTVNIGTHDLRLGLLVGAVAGNPLPAGDARAVSPQISNISIRDCKIDDGPAECSVLTMRSMWVGGVVADISYEKFGSDAFTPSRVPIVNVFADVDITLRKVDRPALSTMGTGGNTRVFQVAVGGILARSRNAASDLVVPQHCTFKGTIDAPRMMAAPIVGTMFGSGTKSETLDFLLLNYYGTTADGWVAGKYASGSDPYENTAGLAAAKDIHFYGYKLADYSGWTKPADGQPDTYVPEVRDITDEFPSRDDGNVNGMRTLRHPPTAEDRAKKDYYSDPSIFAFVQGVNFGQYNAPDDRQQLLDMYTANSTGGVEWQYDATGDYYFMKESSDNRLTPKSLELQIYVDPAQPNVYKTKLQYSNSGLDIDFNGYHPRAYQWYTTTNTADGLWDPMPSETGPTLTVSDADITTNYYKVVVRLDGWEPDELLEDMRGPRTIVYVYDRGVTERIIDAYTIAGVTSGEWLVPSRFYFPPESPEYDEMDPYRVIPDGDDANDGLTPWTAVQTMERAYQLLKADGDWETNIIVIIGAYSDRTQQFLFSGDNLLTDATVTEKMAYGKATTITGTDGMFVNNGKLCLHHFGRKDAVNLQAPLRLDKITLMPDPMIAAANVASRNAGNYLGLMFACNYCDLMVDEDVHFDGYRFTDGALGLPGDFKSVPFINIICGGNNYKDANFSYSPLNQDPDRMTLTLRSGIYARILGAGRNTDNNATSHNITGSPDNMARSRIVINIDGFDENGHAKYARSTEMVEIDGVRKFRFREYDDYTHDVGLLACGQTDGSCYADVEANIYNARIARILSGNITFGRVITSGGKNYPPDSFFGHAVVNIYGGVFNEVYGGNLGRNSSATGILAPCFYGRSAINIYGGRVEAFKRPDHIHNPDITYSSSEGPKTITKSTGAKIVYGWDSFEKNVDPNIYGSGSGGITGMGFYEHHTSDPCIPYYADPADHSTLAYGMYPEARGKMPRLMVIDRSVPSGWSEMSIDTAICEVNLYGGVVAGSVYGAGLGYSNNLSDSKLAPHDTGCFYGRSIVRLSAQPNGQAPIVLGNIYGAGAGAEELSRRFSENYLVEVDKTDATTVANVKNYEDRWRKLYDRRARYEAAGLSGELLDKALSGLPNYNLRWYYDNKESTTRQNTVTPFETVSSQYGPSYVYLQAGTIGDVENRTGGNVYAGARGVEGRTDIAAIYGDTHLEISGDVLILGDIFGGSALGSVKECELDDGSKAGGNTYVRIDGGTLGNGIFGGCEGGTGLAEGQVTKNRVLIDHDTHMTITGGAFSSNALTKAGDQKAFNIYGGGMYACDVRGDTYMQINHSPFVDILSLDTDNYGHDFEAAWNDLTYRRFGVYGGGYGELSGVAGATHVDINIENEDVLVNPAEGRIFYSGKQFFEVVGGGFAGNVNSTNVIIRGNVNMRKVLGGGFYGSVAGNTNVTISSGLIGQAYGGGLMGYVHDAARLTVGTRAGARVRPDMPPVTAEEAAQANNRLWITGNVYGGNDVQGIVGAMVSSDPQGLCDQDRKSYSYDESVLYKAQVGDLSKGAFINIYGGTIQGSVFGAGNGQYRGYYVPGWGRYMDGPARFYRPRPARLAKYRDAARYPEYNRVYKTRPMIGRVNLNIQGNSEDDRVVIEGDVYGGGNLCTVGQWIPELQVEDPRRLRSDSCGVVSVNFGSHVTVKQDVHMGNRGFYIGNQAVVTNPDALRYAMAGDFITLNTDRLDPIGECAYYHWYWDNDGIGVDGKPGRYRLGFPLPGELHKNPVGDHFGQNPDDPEGSYFLAGEHQFYGFNKFIEMPSELRLTFFDEPWQAGQIKQVHPDHMEYSIVRDDANPQYYFDGADIRLGSFYVGGKRGFMTHHNPLQEFDYTYDLAIPYGVTIENRLVCGGEDNYITYHKYANDECTEISDELVYDINGGVGVQSNFNGDAFGTYDEANNVYVNPYPETDGSGIEYAKTHPLPLKKNDEGKWVADIRPVRRTDKFAMRMSAFASFDPQLADDAFQAAPGTQSARDPELEPYRRYGGIVYGGCFQSGVVEGDVVINVGSNLIANQVYDEAPEDLLYGAVSGLDYNVGRVVGAGYGEKSIVNGNIYIYLLKNFKGFNVFGGGMQGDVNGETHVTYIGNEGSHIYGAIYGGGLYGNVGVKDPDKEGRPLYDKPGSYVYLYSGNVDRVYGGACLGDVYGGTSVKITDEVVADLPYLDWDKLSTDGWGEARLIAGNVFGGNDKAGLIFEKEDTKIPTSSVYINETPQPNMMSGGKDSPGSHGGYNGFPLVGRVYAGANGNYGTHTADHQLYQEGSLIPFATGRQAEVMYIDLGTQLRRDGTNFRVPNIPSTRLEIRGGTVVNAYGGGNKATVRDNVNIIVNYADTISRAGFDDPAIANRIWNVLHISGEEQFTEALRANDPDSIVYKYQVMRIFGGNNRADMDIQPRWQLQKGHVGNVYSGSNIGMMTYYNPEADPDSADPYLRSPGLSITIDSEDIRVESVYGGCRMGDVQALDDAGQPVTFDNPDDYGATVNIRNGIIEAVYGGNDVVGYVHNGSRVNISGAISGDVYGAGNGNYLYKYDREGTVAEVAEAFDDQHGYRYFVLPRKDAYGTVDATGNVSISDEQLVLALNSYRPNVSRTFLDIQGRGSDPKETVYVKGNVYCGGNSSTISAIDQGTSEDRNDIRFNIGSNVVLNGVFFGSNGESLADGYNLYETEVLNGINLAKENELANGDVPAEDQDAVDCKDLYPYVLSLLMRAVEVENTPKDFALSPTLENAYIGEFCVGGNHGSMMTNRCIALTFPESLTIYKRIVGGCYDANVSYRGITHVGGLTKEVDPAKNMAKGVQHEKEKVHLEVKCEFKPLYLHYPMTTYSPPILLHDYMVKEDGSPLYIEYPDGSVGIDKSYTGQVFYPNGICNIFGGCYNSGRTVGDIHIDYHSDMLDYEGTRVVDISDYERAPQTDLTATVVDGDINKQAVINGIDIKDWRCFDIYGAGFGRETSVMGDVLVRFRAPEASATFKPGDKVYHPSAATVFGGSHEGLVVGNTRVEVHDGYVLSNVYGASESAVMYGSSSVIVGFPDYYVYTGKDRDDSAAEPAPGIFKLRRSDDLSDKIDGRRPQTNDDGSPVLIDEVRYVPGDILPVNLYDMIIGQEAGGGIVMNKEKVFDRVVYRPKDSPIAVLETDQDGNPVLDGEGKPQYSHTYNVDWDMIDISIGDPYSRKYLHAPYYGHGNVYGAGYVPISSSLTLAGTYTLLKYTDRYNKGAGTAGYGGNSSVIIWDNPNNANPDYPIGEKYAETRNDGSTRQITVRDHVSISTGHYVKTSVKAGTNVMGKYKIDRAAGKFVHQPSGVLEGTEDDNENYYVVEADGGVYGGGRKVFAQGFRAIDIRYYGYADHTPQSPKLLNTFQRAEFLHVEDCVIELQGATDFATDKLDTELYAINRVGELHMASSLPADQNYQAGAVDQTFMNNIRHDVPRSRNYMNFYHSVKYLGCLRSNVAMDAPYHDAAGKVWTYQEKNGDTKVDNSHTLTYEAEKVKHVDQAEMEAKTKYFMMRNVGTSANMIGINNGYSLRIQGFYTENGEEKPYYGPVYGVVEIKLLTLAMGEGGGYVYALNHHACADDHCQAGPLSRAAEEQTFLHKTGNFVFPGAAFLREAGGLGDDNYNYIIDDCMPLTKGYQYYKNHGVEDVNVEQPVHYWYVNGQKYFYNLTLTGYTGQSDDVNPMRFWLNNDDGLVSLSGVTNKSHIHVKSVKWDLHNDYKLANHEDYDCGLTNLAENYKLWLTVDNNTRLWSKDDAHEDHTGTFMVQLPRKDYSADISYDPNQAGDVSNVVNGDASADPETRLYGHFGLKAENAENAPAVGILLEDRVDNSDKDYYNAHLKDPHKVEIVVESIDEWGVQFEYTLNLTINYLLGPYITGNLEIENCALPGEYIYANSNGVTVEIDPEEAGLMSVTERSWFVVPRLADGTYSLERENINECKLRDEYGEISTDREIHIPAYYYQNGWKVQYAVKVNGVYFYVDAADAADHPVLEVHNYHRMRAWDGAKKHDLRLTPGCRVYLEDDDDVKEWFRYLMLRQDASTERVALNGAVIDPQYCNGLNFFLNADVKLPTAEEFSALVDETGIDTPTLDNPLVFKGAYHGNGHVIDILSSTRVPFAVTGSFFNTGFYSVNNSDETCVFNSLSVPGDPEHGTVANCYYYNVHNKGFLLDDPNGTVLNCYQNTRVTDPVFDDNHDLLSVSSSTFHNGLVAYNLNNYHLHRRDVLLHGTPEQMAMKIKDRDLAMRADGEKVEYIERMYNNGDYRYALYKGYDQFTEALRTVEKPNYADMMGNRATHHDIAHTVDASRWSDDEQQYLPDYKRGDYLFFGQDLTQRAFVNSTLTEEERLPRLYSPETRVYRASGYYGSKVDKGFYFNKECYVSSPLLTAIDFIGYADEINKGVTARTNDWILTGTQELMFPPAIDLPRDDADDPLDFKLPFLIHPDVTKNLLLYGSMQNVLINPSSLTGMAAYNAGYNYQDGIAAEASMRDLVLRGDVPSDVTAHHIVGDPADLSAMPYAYGGYLHLVDGEDFNCPIAFRADNAVFYNRTPLAFADGTQDKSGWDGICLPFTAKTAYSVSASGNKVHDHRELTHFYDNDQRMHEYWLRRYVKADGGKLYFQRPMAENAGDASDEVADLNYFNTFFSEMYANQGYVQAHDQYAAPIVHKDYRFLTARVPYIMSFPGKRYCEFDLSGEFFRDLMDETTAWQQAVGFFSAPGAVVPVTDDNQPVAYSAGGYQHLGTFTHVAAQSAAMARIDYQDGAQGTHFKRASVPGEIIAEPFHTYVMQPGYSAKPLKIASMPDEVVDMPADDETPGDALEIYVQFNELVIESPYEEAIDIPLYDTLGRMHQMLKVQAGTNRYAGLAPNYYLVKDVKVLITE